jgi:protein-S-isoprenylcysteine O-methyltransferase Ste14
VEGWYRLLYNIASVLTLVPPLFFLVTLPDRLLYALSFPWSIVCLVFQVVGAGGILISLFSTDMWRFAGVAQVLEYLSGKPVVSSEVPLRLDGLYRLVRHPLYLFSLLVIWPVPVMTWNLLCFIVGATAYFAVGSMVEERRLEQEYGDAYRQYRRRVPWLFPWPRP